MQPLLDGKRPYSGRIVLGVLGHSDREQMAHQALRGFELAKEYQDTSCLRFRAFCLLRWLDWLTGLERGIGIRKPSYLEQVLTSFYKGWSILIRLSAYGARMAVTVRAGSADTTPSPSLPG